MQFSLTELTALITGFMWPLVRISAMFAVMPVISAVHVPPRVRAGLALVLTLLVAPLLPPPPDVSPISAAGMVMVFHQVVVGLAMGFTIRLIFVVFELVGQVIAQHMALHFASLVDPNSGVQMPMLGQFYIILATLVFLAINGHLVAIEILVESFRVLPVGQQGLGADGLWALVAQMGWVFTSAVMFALPAIAALLVVNLAFGVMTRAAPQLNIFSVGFPITLLMGLGVIFFTLPLFVRQMTPLIESALEFLNALIGAG